MRSLVAEREQAKDLEFNQDSSVFHDIRKDQKNTRREGRHAAKFIIVKIVLFVSEI